MFFGAPDPMQSDHHKNEPLQQKPSVIVVVVVVLVVVVVVVVTLCIELVIRCWIGLPL